MHVLSERQLPFCWTRLSKDLAFDVPATVQASIEFSLPAFNVIFWGSGEADARLHAPRGLSSPPRRAQ